MKSILTTCLLISLTLGLHAQPGQWETIGQRAQSDHFAVLEGQVLLGTLGAGLVHWDAAGQRTHVNTLNSALPSDQIGRLAIAPGGHWWVATAAGISRYDASTWTNWSLDDIGLPPAVPVRNIRVAPDTSVYVLTDEGFARYHNGGWLVLNTSNSTLPYNVLNDVVFAPDGKIYFGSWGSGILLLDGEDWTVYNSAVTGVSTMTYIVGLALAPDGALWAIGSHVFNFISGIRLVSFSGGVWTGHTGASIGIGPGMFASIVSDPTHGVWTRNTYGLSHLTPGGWVHYTTNEVGCAASTDRYMALDAEGQLWLNGGCGFIRSDGQSWEYFDTGLPGYCRGAGNLEAVAEDNEGNLWLGPYLSQCITKTDGNNWTHFNPYALGASENSVNTVFTDQQGRIWFGMDNSELLIHDQGQWTLLDTCATIFPGHWIRTIAESPGGDIWLAFTPLPSSSQLFAGVARYAGGQWTFWTSTEVPNLNGFILALESNDDGVLWASVFGKGLLRFDGSTWALFDTSNSGLPSNDIFDITTAPDGTLWLATSAGLVSYDGQQWTVTNTANSDLPSDRLRKLAFDHTGGLYVGYLPSAAGHVTAILRDGQWTEISPPSAPAFTNLDPVTAMIVDSRNRMIFTTSGDDFYIYDPMIMVNATDIPAKQHNDWSVSPNPGADAFYLRSSALLPNQGYVSLYDLHGRRLIRVPLQSADTPYQIGGLPAGMYVIEVAVSGERPEYLRWVRH